MADGIRNDGELEGVERDGERLQRCRERAGRHALRECEEVWKRRARSDTPTQLSAAAATVLGVVVRVRDLRGRGKNPRSGIKKTRGKTGKACGCSETAQLVAKHKLQRCSLGKRARVRCWPCRLRFKQQQAAPNLSLRMPEERSTRMSTLGDTVRKDAALWSASPILLGLNSPSDHRVDDLHVARRMCVQSRSGTFLHRVPTLTRWDTIQPRNL